MHVEEKARLTYFYK